MKTAIVHVQTQIRGIRYICSECGQTISYETDGLPPKEQCHSCLTLIHFTYEYDTE